MDQVASPRATTRSRTSVTQPVQHTPIESDQDLFVASLRNTPIMSDDGFTLNEWICNTREETTDSVIQHERILEAVEWL